MKLSFQIHRGRHSHRPPLSLHTPWKNNNTYVGVTSVPSSSIQRNLSHEDDWKTFALWAPVPMDIGLSHQQLDWKSQLLYSSSEPPPPLPWRHSKSLREQYCKARPDNQRDFKRQWEFMSGGDQSTIKSTPWEREQYPARRQQKQGAKCWF